MDFVAARSHHCLCRCTQEEGAAREAQLHTLLSIERDQSDTIARLQVRHPTA